MQRDVRCASISIHQQSVLLTVVMIVASCGLLYELLISSLSSYLLGSSVLHFSLTIGLFMFFMGVGSYVSRFVVKDLLEAFVVTEIAVGFVGGLSALMLHAAFSFSEWYYLVAFFLIATISVLVGLEIPLVTRILEPSQGLRNSVASVFAFDYLGALLASIIFPLLLLPYLGTLKTALVVGALNLGVAGVTLYEFRRELRGLRRMSGATILGLIILTILGVCSEPLASIMERAVYQDEIILSRQSAYQKIVITKFNDDVRLFLNGNIQFSTIDEYRYHEPLVHIPIGLMPQVRRVLLLGAGDGLAVREVLKHPEIESVTLVDLDPEMLKLGLTHPVLSKINEGSLSDSRVRALTADAYTYLQSTSDLFSVIIADLPDPNDHSLGKLYSQEFYQLVQRHLEPGGIFITQATSPYYARNAYWCIGRTLSEVFPHVWPLQVHVPSFGPWGFQMASMARYDVDRVDLAGIDMRFLEHRLLPTMLLFDGDTSQVPVEPNSLSSQALVQYYEQGWEQFN
jgi:spermidine synthase